MADSCCDLAAMNPPLPERPHRTHKPVLVQEVLPKSAIKRFDIGVVRRLSWPREAQRDLIPIGPEIDVFGDELRAIINPDRLRFSVIFTG